MSDNERRTSVNLFYELIDKLSDRIGGARYLATSSGQDEWPQRGVYFFFEHGELREGGEAPRVVRVGTHALAANSRTLLWSRLSQHRGTVGGSNPGGGSHRGSVFRRHIGMAILGADSTMVKGRSTWGRGSNASASVRDGESKLEIAVSTVIRKMPFVWLPVLDNAGPLSGRGAIEVGAISLLSNFKRTPIDPPSESWLGRTSDREKIRDSGLWNIRHVEDQPSPGFIEALSSAIDQIASPGSDTSG
ncbi:hypothetical protein IMCC26256_11460 [Actinobacteria bacterium IMCC26256]|nr:hypothetical protein IMCC26256_11460 [Actinobacteria bacterium IMCC26256]